MGLSLEETNARRMLFEQQTSFGILKRDVKIGLTVNGGEVKDTRSSPNFIIGMIEINRTFFF